MSSETILCKQTASVTGRKRRPRPHLPIALFLLGAQPLLIEQRRLILQTMLSNRVRDSPVAPRRPTMVSIDDFPRCGSRRWERYTNDLLSRLLFRHTEVRIVQSEPCGGFLDLDIVLVPEPIIADESQSLSDLSIVERGARVALDFVDKRGRSIETIVSTEMVEANEIEAIRMMRSVAVLRAWRTGLTARIRHHGFVRR